MDRERGEAHESKNIQIVGVVFQDIVHQTKPTQTHYLPQSWLVFRDLEHRLEKTRR
jgi:hypothetical protein